jgi:hypothetical protein
MTPKPDVINIAQQEAQAATEGWLHRSLVAIDVAANVIILRGRQGETISAHSYRAYLEGKAWGKVLNAFLNFFQANHGAKAAAGDLERAQAMVTLQKKTLGLS